MKHPPIVNVLYDDGSRFVANQRGAFAAIPPTDRSRAEARAASAYRALAGEEDEQAWMRRSAVEDFTNTRATILRLREDAVRQVKSGTNPTTFWTETEVRKDSTGSLLLLCRISYIRSLTRQVYRAAGQSQHGKGLGRV